MAAIMLRTVSLVSYFKSLIIKKVILIFNHKIVLCNILYAKVASWIISADIGMFFLYGVSKNCFHVLL